MPLGWRLERFGGGEARVAIWQVVVLAEAAGPQAIATWSTSRLVLRWTPTGWRLAGYLNDENGPAPAANYPGPGTPPDQLIPVVERFRSLAP
jgi:hypothetical protein